MLRQLRPVWAYRGFVLGSVKREFQLRYRNSVLGAIWMVLQPLSMILVYTVIFSQIMQAKLPGVDGGLAYSIYLCAGILSWGLFADICTRSQKIFIDNANLLKKLSFPKLCLPTTVVFGALLDFFIIFSLFLLFLLLTGNFPGLVFLAVVPLLLLLVAFSVGLGMVLGVLNVFFRDISLLFGLVINFWFWFTPVIYPLSILPESVQVWMVINPMAAVMAGMQGVFVQGQWPQWSALLYPLALSVFLCLLGWRLFRRHAADMVDEL